MLVFGPYIAIPKNKKFTIYNLSSPTENITRLPGLLVVPPSRVGVIEQDELIEKSFDMWYYHYVLEDPVACSSLMLILTSLYAGDNVYICIADYQDDYISIINESFMKILQSRYDLKYFIVNNSSDFEYIVQDGCDFASVAGIKNFDDDRNRYRQLMEEESLLHKSSQIYSCL